jgi:hypothetical protein
MSEKGRHWPFFLVALTLSVVTLWGGATTLWSVARELQSLWFAPVDATVVSYGPRAIDGEPRYVLEYRYRGGVEDVTGLRRFPTPGPLAREEEHGELLQRFTPGTAITAYVNPFDRGDAVTSPGLRATTLYPLLFIVPALLVSFGAWNLAWRTWRGLRPGELSDVARVLDAAGGDWTLRVMRLSPWAQGAAAMGLSALLAGFALLPESGRPYLSHLIAAWAAVLAIAAAVYALTAWRMRKGAFDWSYSARRAELRAPSGKWLRKSELARLGVARVDRKDSDGDPVHDAIVQLHPRAGPPMDVITASSGKSFEEALAEVRPVARFLEERLGLRDEQLQA